MTARLEALQERVSAVALLLGAVALAASVSLAIWSHARHRELQELRRESRQHGERLAVLESEVERYRLAFDAALSTEAIVRLVLEEQAR